MVRDEVGRMVVKIFLELQAREMVGEIFLSVVGGEVVEVHRVQL